MNVSGSSEKSSTDTKHSCIMGSKVQFLDVIGNMVEAAGSHGLGEKALQESTGHHILPFVTIFKGKGEKSFAL